MNRPIYSPDKVEALRIKRGLSQNMFSKFLGFNMRTYNMALRRGQISEWMAERICQRLHVSKADLLDGG